LGDLGALGVIAGLVILVRTEPSTVLLQQHLQRSDRSRQPDFPPYKRILFHDDGEVRVFVKADSISRRGSDNLSVSTTDASSSIVSGEALQVRVDAIADSRNYQSLSSP
jgi:hypothetical protein